MLDGCGSISEMRRVEPFTRALNPSAGIAVLGCFLILLGVVFGITRLRPPPPLISPPAIAGAPQGSPSVVFVHVAGEVRKAGLYELPEGSRVADALEAAGGATAKADVDALNLAQIVADGMRIAVPLKGEPGAAGAPSAGATTPALISINSADVAQLETVPGLGPVKAAAIVAFREQNGGFAAMEELLEVSGIGPATFETISPFLTL